MSKKTWGLRISSHIPKHRLAHDFSVFYNFIFFKCMYCTCLFIILKLCHGDLFCRISTFVFCFHLEIILLTKHYVLVSLAESIHDEFFFQGAKLYYLCRTVFLNSVFKLKQQCHSNKILVECGSVTWQRDSKPKE